MEIFLDNLISSSLVIAFNEIGNLPACQIHDLVHDFCLIKAREEKLFVLISSSEPSSSDLMPRIVNIYYDKEHFGSNNFILLDSKMKKHSGKHLYSLLVTGHKMFHSLSDACHLRHLRLLRVLILYPSFMMVEDSLLNEISMLNHLRFLYIGTKVKSLPSSFSNLFREHERIRETRETKHIFKRFPNLQRLSFVPKESWDNSTERYWFPKLDFLTELDFLRIDFENSNTNDCGSSVATNWSWDFHLPSNLKKLVLNDFPLTSDSLSTIVRLPNLENLFLERTIMQGEEWNMGEEDTFVNLKFLELEEVTLAKWEFGEESFPVLEKLKLCECCKLEEIPPNFGDAGSLKIIQLVESPHLEDSARKIKEYVEDMLGGELEVLGPNNIPLFK
ncbi:hypothetical protein P3S67_000668 [Capsicum chacoense]